MEGDETIEGDELIEVIRPFTSRALRRRIGLRLEAQDNVVQDTGHRMGGRRLKKLGMERLVRRPEPTYHHHPPIVPQLLRSVRTKYGDG